MPAFVETIAVAIERLIDGAGRLTSWLILGVVAMLFLQIPMREFVRYGHREVNDIGQLLHAIVFMIGAAYAMRWNGHVRVDLFYNRFGERAKAAIDLLGTLLFILPWLVIVTRDSLPIVLNSWRAREAFAETFTPGYFLLKTQLLVFASLIFLQAIANTLRAMQRLVR